jgi:hypothetical protein
MGEMEDKVAGKIERAKKEATPTVSLALPDGSLVEMVYRPEENRTLFCVSKNSEFRYETNLLVNGQRLVPYFPRNNLLTNEVVVFPSEPWEYDSEEKLIEDIRAFIHRYVDVSPLFEQIASYYVLFTWVYDAFNELPYLCLRGDTGSGKTRFLLTAGSLCYKPIFASGASTVSPVFRILDSMRGTLIVDEGDFRFSDEKAELVKILNNGNGRGFPVLRSESVSGKEFSPRAYTVFGPKLIATRGYFQDRALESRCLTEETGGRKLRDDIPINLTADYKRQALELRNKLLMFRFRNLGKRTIDPTLVDRSIEPRLAQVFVPPLSVIEDAGAPGFTPSGPRPPSRAGRGPRNGHRGPDFGDHSRTTRLIIWRRAFHQGNRQAVIEQHGEDFERKITPHWIGHIVRKKLQLKTERHREGFVIAPQEGTKLARLFEKYGIDTEPVNSVNSVNSGEDAEPSADAQHPLII